MIHKIVLNSLSVPANTKPNGNSSVPFLINFGFLDPHKHYKCQFTFRSQSGEFDLNSVALIHFNGGPLSSTYTTNNNSSSYSYSSILGTIYASNFVDVNTGQLIANIEDNPSSYFISPNQQSSITVELRDLTGNLLEAVQGPIPEWIMILSFEEVSH